MPFLFLSCVSVAPAPTTSSLTHKRSAHSTKIVFCDAFVIERMGHERWIARWRGRGWCPHQTIQTVRLAKSGVQLPAGRALSARLGFFEDGWGQPSLPCAWRFWVGGPKKRFSIRRRFGSVSRLSNQEMSTEIFSLEGKTALVTGSSTGLGKRMAVALGQAGAKVAMNYYNNEERAAQALSEFEATGAEGAMIRADVTDEADVNRLVAEAGEKLGPIDIVILNATPDQPQMPIEEYDWDFYQSMLDFFIKSPYLVTRAVLPHMKKQRWGRIINIGSEGFHLGVTPFTAYVSAKGGQNGFNRSLAHELAPWNITVNMIAPGWIPVERHEKDPQELKDGYFASIPMQRWGVPEDLAGTIIYLASEASSFVTGQNIHVNGGTTVH